jgi:hypothetical protein
LLLGFGSKLPPSAVASPSAPVWWVWRRSITYLTHAYHHYTPCIRGKQDTLRRIEFASMSTM